MYKYKIMILLLAILLSATVNAQSLNNTLQTAWQQLEKEEQCAHATMSLYVVESKSGQIVFDKNSQQGLAPASCQKIISSATAFSLLGNNYKFKTELGYEGDLKNGALTGNFYVIGYGDPSLGSWRWKQTNEEMVLNEFKTATAKKIKSINGNIFGYDRKYESNITPRGWIWEDIGNYYGAGASGLNWRENQYDLYLKAGDKIGDKASIIKMVPRLENIGLYSELTTAAKGSGDNAYVFLPPYSPAGYVRGTIPLGENNFKIAAAVPDPGGYMIQELLKVVQLPGDKILFTGSFNGIEIDKKDLAIHPIVFYTHYSPSLDSLNYWFLKKSINLYGEALVKAMAYEKNGFGSTDSGIALIKRFWKDKGIDPAAINILDGSGLSPANRVTTHSLVTILQYAKQQNWYNSFYNALPEMNGIHMKDGYIGGVRSYSGYIKSKSGAEYSFSFIVNNFSGSAGTMREKMWRLLDLLK